MNEWMASPDRPDISTLQETAEHEMADPYENPEQHEPPEREAPEPAEHRPRLQPTVRFYIAAWLPAAGALLAYSAMHGSVWAGFVGLELLVVGWYTLAAL